jgi:hypothetical protein
MNLREDVFFSRVGSGLADLGGERNEVSGDGVKKWVT